MDVFAQLAERIIREQQAIIGPLAMEQARQVTGIKVEGSGKTVEVEITGNKTDALEQLIEQYQSFFGRASVEVCRSAARELLDQLPPAQVPQLLR